jgi:hypothetical protein
MNSKEISSTTLVGRNHVQWLVFEEFMIEQTMSSTVAGNAYDHRKTIEYK